MPVFVVPLLLMLAGRSPPWQAGSAASGNPAQQAPPTLYNETADWRAQLQQDVNGRVRPTRPTTSSERRSRTKTGSSGWMSAGELPHLTVLDGKGHVLAQQPARGLAAAQGSQTVSAPDGIAACLPRRQVPPVAADPLLVAALAEAKRDGKAIVTSDGPKGNAGSPVAPHEIAHFRTMLEQSKPTLTAGDSDVPIASLEEANET